MHIAIVTHNVINGDGQGRANLEIARYALRQKIQVTLFADRVDADLAQTPGLEWVRIQPNRRGNWLTYGLEFAAQSARKLQKTRSQFDVVHAYGATLNAPHDVNTSQFVHSAWRQSPVHVAKTNKNLYGAYQWLYSAVNAHQERTAYHQAKIVVAASSTVRDELETIVGIAPDRLRVILNGANLDEFKPGVVSRAALGLPEGVPLALFAGDIRTGRKNLDTVLKALSLTPQSPVHLAVVGRVEGSPFPAMAQNLGVAERVHFLDFRKDIADIMRAADMFVFPSRYEACALVLVEAIASGLPVITAKTTGGSEVVTPESGVLLDDPNDATALSNALEEIAASPERRKAMGQRARQEAEKYSWENIATRYMEVYAQCAR